MKCFDIRAVQIDLARQIETMETVKRYFDVAAEAGMNMVVLYLEDRIKTATYPYSPDEESYTPDEVREMVAYADALGLELVPVVSPIGHAERFMRHAELKYLAELRGKIAGAFTPAGVEHYLATCPNLKETHAFMDAYITEVAALFPGRYFHIGFDEIHDMGFCELCKNTPKPELFINALNHYYELVKGLGKEVMIWDDMMEQVPSLLDRIPNDIILCAWFYQYTERYPHARFCSSVSYDLFEEFERRGFRYLACCWDGSSTESLTAYARKKNTWGMLMTNWCYASEDHVVMLYPQVHYAGALWRGDIPLGTDALFASMKQFADTDEGAQALALAMTSVRPATPTVPGDKAAYHVPDEFAYYQRNMLQSIVDALGKATGDEAVLTTYLIHMRWELMRYRLWDVGYALHEYRAGEGTTDIEQIREAAAACQREVAQLCKDSNEQWERFRPGMVQHHFAGTMKRYTDAADWVAKAAETATAHDHGRLVVRYQLTEYTAACKTRLTVQYADGSTYEASCGNFKGLNLRLVHHERSFEVPVDKEPVAITIDVSGYGGTGFRYLSITTPDGKQYLPSSIGRTSGVVQNPHHLLTWDSRAAVFGEEDMLQIFNNGYPTAREHSVTVNLGEWKI